MSYDRILYAAVDGVVTVTLNRPSKRNALDGGTVRELGEALLQAAQDDGARVIVLRGAGPDFCAGADLAELEEIASGVGPMDNLAAAHALGDLLAAMRRHPLPIVAAVHGHAIAGGAGLATACDLVLAREDAIFGYPEVQLGFVPAMVMAPLRRAVGEKVAFELVTRGERISAEQGRRLGVVNRIFAADTFDDDVATFVDAYRMLSASAVRLIKRLLYGMDGLSYEEAIARGAEVNVLARMTEDTRQGVRRFLEKKQD